MTIAHWTVDDFFEDAQAMRAAIDQHFDESRSGQLPFDQRAIWNYWYVDKTYTYLRAMPQRMYPGPHQAFMKKLALFAAWEFGMGVPSGPYLSMYVAGCGQAIHNDAKNGRLAYVYSLTRWAERHFDGGETIVFKLKQPSRTEAAATTNFYDLIEPVFNRLLVFDDRIAHGVRPISGTMNPHDARFVVHGHLCETPRIAFTQGGLKDISLDAPWVALREDISALMRDGGQHGFITFEATVAQTGQTQSAGFKHVQLFPTSDQARDAESLATEALRRIGAAVWPVAAGPSRLVFAVSSNPIA